VNRILTASITAAAAVAIALGSTAAFAKGNAESGKAKAAQVCAACHGPDGNKPTGPDFPILAGQHADFLKKALADYKSGKRNNPIMKGFAATLSNQEMDDLAAWFASQPSNLVSHR
jgi:cytochrome c553